MKNDDSEDRPLFLRLTILVQSCDENAAIISDIARYAESRIVIAKGGKLIKIAHELVDCMETYGSKFPPVPRAGRRPDTLPVPQLEDSPLSDSKDLSESGNHDVTTAGK